MDQYSDERPLETAPATEKRSRTWTISGWHIAFVTALTVFAAVTAFAAGLITERALFRGESPLGAITGDTPFADVDEMAQLLRDEYYYRPDSEAEREAFNQSLAYAAATGMTAALEDPYTTFLPPEQARPAAAHLDGEFGGIGVNIQFIDGRLSVVSPIAGSPADEAGIEPGDVIVAADGQEIEGLTPEEAGTLIRGPVGTPVELRIERNGAAEPLILEIVREEIEIQVVYYQQVEETTVAHIRITAFTDKTIPQLDAALSQAIKDEVTGIVLDLRDNGGGLVTAAQELIGRFVVSDAGPALWEDEDAGPGGLTSLPILPGSVAVYELPLLVITNGGTASAAEIVAGALRDYDRAILIGESTFGKGLVQRIWNFGDGASARVTVARWLTPDQTEIPEDGLAVNLRLELAPSSLQNDPTAPRAAQALRTGGWSLIAPEW